MLWAWLWVVGVGADQFGPSTTLQDNHKYYTLSVYQNNIANSFEENFIDMENAEIKQGELYNLNSSNFH